MQKFISLLSIFFATSCSHVFYQPDTLMYTDITKIQKYVKQIEVQGASGKLIAWQFSNPEPKGVDKKNIHLLFFHGNAQNISSHFISLFWILEKGYDFTIFDYPGYGGSDGEATRESVASSGIEMFRWLKAQNPYQKIVIFGQSLGGNIALYTAAQVGPDQQLCAVAVESTFLSYQNVARRVLARIWSTWLFQPLAYVLVSDSYSAVNEIKNLKHTPLMVLHGNRDEIIEFNNGKELYRAAPDPKQFVEVQNGHHIDAFTFSDRNKYQSLFLRFIDTNCGSSF